MIAQNFAAGLPAFGKKFAVFVVSVAKDQTANII